MLSFHAMLQVHQIQTIFASGGVGKTITEKVVGENCSGYDGPDGIYRHIGGNHWHLFCCNHTPWGR